MLEIKTQACGIIQTNTYLLHDDSQAVLFDAADNSYEKILRRLDELKLELKAVILTHGHWDHVFDAYKFQKAGIPLYAHADTLPFLDDPMAMTTFPVSGLEFEPATIDVEITHGMEKEFLGTTLKFHEVPGHCPGSLAVQIPELKSCITGDLIFFEGVGRTDFPGGSSAQLTRSIKNVIYKMAGDTVLYPGHGPSTTVDHEKNNNPFILGR